MTDHEPMQGSAPQPIRSVTLQQHAEACNDTCNITAVLECHALVANHVALTPFLDWYTPPSIPMIWDLPELLKSSDIPWWDAVLHAPFVADPPSAMKMKKASALSLICSAQNICACALVPPCTWEPVVLSPVRAAAEQHT